MEGWDGLAGVGWVGSECPTSAAETGKAGKVGSAAKMPKPQIPPQPGAPRQGGAAPRAPALAARCSEFEELKVALVL